MKGHESNRIDEMEVMIGKMENGEDVDSRDHRVVQAIAMLAMSRKMEVRFSFPDCVSKSWPRFWDFLGFVGGMGFIREVE